MQLLQIYEDANPTESSIRTIGSHCFKSLTERSQCFYQKTPIFLPFIDLLSLSAQQEIVRRFRFEMGRSKWGDTLITAFNLEIRNEYCDNNDDEGFRGRTPLQIAISRTDYAMAKLLIESRARIHEADIIGATNESCKTIIWWDAFHDGRYQSPSPGTDSEEPRWRAFRAVI